METLRDMKKNDEENIISLVIILSIFFAIFLLTLYYREWLPFILVVITTVSSTLLLNRTIKYPVRKGLVSIVLGLFTGFLLWVGLFLMFFATMD
jgi:hypothetical protein